MENQNKEKICYILRGLPGSGKSHLSKELNEKLSGVTYSTDDFFIDENSGKYIFNPKKITQAHQWNQERTKKAMENGITPILVDNTNTMKWEAKPYVEFSVQFNYKVEFVETNTSWRKDPEELAKRNKHNVPKEAILKMLERWEEDFTVENVLKSKPPKRKNNNNKNPTKNNNNSNNK
eukprot:TRINITY_DN2202_c0_g1_i1.p1 TRINITY_DN2202_c0_g1~~TRINITY_DN2202_c0_g1_i1.p1  ORF type:complete len:178 (+),score=45.09 TRINITY_DN2202_c0_g1_i1:187-720(+)